MVEEMKKFICSMQQKRAFATVRFLRTHIDKMSMSEVKLALAAASKPLRSGGASHVFVDPSKMCMEPDLFDVGIETLALKPNCAMKTYQCALLNRLQDDDSGDDERAAKRAKINSVSFDLRTVDFAVLEHMDNYFEVVSRLDPVFQELLDTTHEDDASASVPYAVSTCFVNDDSYDSVIVPLVKVTESGLRILSAVLMAVQDMCFVPSPSVKGILDCRPLACRAI
tara:strand:- start:140 stop:814 length:675 start_codon:yes stop_codon:yes gene_type:complete